MASYSRQVDFLDEIEILRAGTSSKQSIVSTPPVVVRLFYLAVFRIVILAVEQT